MDGFDTEGVTVVIIDLDAGRAEEMAALERMMLRIGAWPPVIVVTQSFDAEVARSLLQMRVADFLVKPVQPVELVRTCARVARASDAAETTEAQIYTFIPAVGGAGVTTLAIQTALLLLNSGQRDAPHRPAWSTSISSTAPAPTISISSRGWISKEIEPRPERLDRQLLEIMLSHHASGLEVIAAPNRPAEMRTFDPDMVTRLLDLVSSHFDYVVIDMPRTWFSWTDSVLLGSNRLFIVSEMTVPSIRQAKALVAAIRERLGDGPQPQVIVNRFEQRMFDSGLQEGRHRTGARRRLRRHHPEQLPAGARGDRPRRAARRGQGRQQHHHAAQEADAAADAAKAGRAAAPGLRRQARLRRWRRRRHDAAASPPAAALPRSRRRLAERAAARAGADVLDGVPRRSRQGQARRPSRPTRCSPTSCSTPRSACTAG